MLIPDFVNGSASRTVSAVMPRGVEREKSFVGGFTFQTRPFSVVFSEIYDIAIWQMLLGFLFASSIATPIKGVSLNV